jgi:hypothetical protein
MKRFPFTTLVTAAAFALGPAACRDPGTPAGSKAPKDEVVTLTDNGGTTECHVSGKNPTIHRDHGQALHFIVMNGCGVSATFSLDFGTGTNPLQPFNAVVVGAVDTGKLNTTVRNDAAKGTYPFKFLVNGRPQTDPDIVIDN